MTLAEAILAGLIDTRFSRGAIVIADAGNINASGSPGSDGERRISQRRIALLSRGTGKTIVARNGLARAIRAATKPRLARGHGTWWSAQRSQAIGAARIENGMTNISHGTIRVERAEFSRRNATTDRIVHAQANEVGLTFRALTTRVARFAGQRFGIVRTRGDPNKSHENQEIRRLSHCFTMPNVPAAVVIHGPTITTTSMVPSGVFRVIRISADRSSAR